VSYLSKVADFNLPDLHLAAPMGVIWSHSNFAECGTVCVILCLAILIQYWRVTDRQMDKQTDGPTTKKQSSFITSLTECNDRTMTKQLTTATQDSTE